MPIKMCNIETLLYIFFLSIRSPFQDLNSNILFVGQVCQKEFAGLNSKHRL